MCECQGLETEEREREGEGEERERKRGGEREGEGEGGRGREREGERKNISRPGMEGHFLGKCTGPNNQLQTAGIHQQHDTNRPIAGTLSSAM